MNLQDAILEVLKECNGQRNRISRRRLREQVGYRLNYHYPSDRKLRMAIEELRRTHLTGALICSSSGVGGYWLAEDMDELLESYREERRRAINILVTIRARLRRGKIAFSGQQQLL